MSLKFGKSLLVFSIVLNDKVHLAGIFVRSLPRKILHITPVKPGFRLAILRLCALAQPKTAALFLDIYCVQDA